MYIMCLSKGLAAVSDAISEGLLPNKRLGFIPTAGETYQNPYFVDESRQQLREQGLQLVEIDVTNRDKEELIDALHSVDGIYVAGGNSFHLLLQLQKKGLVGVLRKLIQDGKPYFGESAGAVILYATIEPVKPIDDPQDVPEITNYTALGLIDFIPLPHIDREKYKDLFAKFLHDNQDKYHIVPFRDEQAILVRNGKGFEIVPSPVVAA